MSLLTFIFGNNNGSRTNLKCKKCNKEGGMYKKGGVVNTGQFELIGKNDDARLIIVCNDCKTMYFYDPLWNKMSEVPSDQMIDIYSNLLK